MNANNLPKITKLNGSPNDNIETLVKSQYKEITLISPDNRRYIVHSIDNPESEVKNLLPWQKDIIFAFVQAINGQKGLEVEGTCLWVYNAYDFVKEKLTGFSLKFSPNKSSGLSAYESTIDTMLEAIKYRAIFLNESLEKHNVKEAKLEEKKNGKIVEYVSIF